MRKPSDYVQDFTSGYKSVGKGENLDQGYTCYDDMELDDPFEAFETENKGVVGGAQTVNDYSPEGLDWDNDNVAAYTRKLPGDSKKVSSAS